MRDRLDRVRHSGRLIVGAILTGVALIGALGFLADRFGYGALVAIGAVTVVVIGAALVMPERTWSKLAGEETLLADLGTLHAEGADLRMRLRDLTDEQVDVLDQWERDTNEWLARVQDLLRETPWLGTFQTPVDRGIQFQSKGRERVRNYSNQIDGWLERLGQIVAALSR